jgi:release factor glutamine methyltransferase
VAYLLGTREFWGMTFRVTAAVLIPRPETELLLERALAISGPSGVAVDVGTGSGCLALSFALERPRWEVYATDTSADALSVARQNLEVFDTGERVHVLCGSLLGPVSRPIDLVMANLPYVPAHEISDLEPEVRVWEPRAALDGGSDGLDPIRGLLAQLPEKIVPDGVCLLELDPRQFDELDRIVASRMPGWRVIRHQDLARRDRVAEVRAFTPS